MRHIRQPEGSNLCGQACIAMLGNMTLWEAIEFLGTKGRTTTKIMVEALRAGGFKCGSKLKRTSNDGALPPFSLCLVHIRNEGQHSGHWVIWNGKDQRFYDPGFFEPVSEEFYYVKGGRITSYLKIRRRRSETNKL